MKKSLLFTALMTALLVTASIGTSAPYSSFPEPSSLSECAAPDMPDLPEDDFLCGDVNGDGAVNVLDIITVVNYILGGTPSPFNLDAADINADNSINVLDIIGIVNIILQTPRVPCPCVPSVTYEEKIYATMQIGDQCWFRENLNVGTMITVNTGGHLQTDNGLKEKYCYGNDPGNCAAYGGLYEWHEAMQYVTDEGAQGICPPGWHIPTDAEWKVLEGTVDSQYPVGDPEWDRTGDRGFDAGKNLKTTSGWQDGGNGTNLSGFTGLPAGHRYEDGFYEMGSMGLWWTSSEAQYNLSWQRYIPYYYDGVFRTEYPGGDNGFSVRCLKGCWPEPTQSNAGPDQLNVPGTSTTLAGNTPTFGTGVWGIVSGTGGTFVDPWSPNAEFQGQAGNEYTLSWTITTQCGSSTDEVVISFVSGGGFTCGNNLEYEGQSYATVLIGTQCWMAENLNVGTKINSAAGGYQQQDNGTFEKYCYNNDEANCDIYGGLYEWPEAMQYVTTEGAQGICPAEWHIPTDDEWKVLEGTVDSQYPVGDPEWDEWGFRGYDAGGNLKEAGMVHWDQPNEGATNSSGFTGLPGGYRFNDDGSFNEKSHDVFFWSSSPYDPDNAWLRNLNYLEATVGLFNGNKAIGSSVRCIKDCSPQPTPASAGPDQINIPGTSTTLAGNTPASGTGIWDILNGTGGMISDPLNPTSEFQGQGGNTYILRWTISTVCGSSQDEVVISFAGTGGQPCPGIPTVGYGGQVYNTVQISDQCWLKENLNIGTMIDSYTFGQLQTNNQFIEKYCYNNDPFNCTIYGGIYEWGEAMQYVTTEGARGICPMGWHIPTDSEWKTLEGTVDSQFPVGNSEWDDTGWRGSDAGGNLKESGTSNWNPPNTGATNSSGFTAQPWGYRLVSDGNFYGLSNGAYFWSSSQGTSIHAWSRYLYYETAQIFRSYNENNNGFSIRCIKDE